MLRRPDEGERERGVPVCLDGVGDGALSDAKGERSGPTSCGAVALLLDVFLSAHLILPDGHQSFG